MNDNYTLKVKSSSGDYYEVKFQFNYGLMSVSCGCVAGGLKQLCKHKDALLNCDATILFDETENETLDAVYKLICDTNYQREFESFQAALNQIEDQKKELAKQTKMVKAMFARKLSEGL